MKDAKSPYIENGYRLSDVIAAIQVMGSYPWASRKAEDWQRKLGEPLSADKWITIYSEHPEFFRVSGEWVSLRWRHAYDRIFDVSKNRELSPDEVRELNTDENDNLTRRPLGSDQIEALLSTAIDLHSRAIARQQESRWWLQLLIPLLVGLMSLLGVIIGILLPRYLSLPPS